MLYLNANHLEEMGVLWPALINEIRNGTRLLAKGEFSQPIKPYLRYGDPRNRIIAMPAYIGGAQPVAGIKWIASFPDNIHKGIPRAHSVTVLNQPSSGVPDCIINTTTVSAIRTAAVSGLLAEQYLANRESGSRYNVGIVGLGPIGRMHLKMIEALLGGNIGGIKLFDLKGIDAGSIETAHPEKISIAASWQECYDDADIFITCTVSDKPYINRKPKAGSLQLNVSLRDYQVETRAYMDVIIVDDWEEVCRQNTDIENMHKMTGLMKEDTISIADVVCEEKHSRLFRSPEEVIMFNPMGMAVYDVVIGSYYYRLASERKVGIELPD